MMFTIPHGLFSRKNILIGVLGALILAFVGGSLYFLNTTCSPAPKSEPQAGSQGYRIWSGPTYESFEHGNKKICVPDGWEAVGATKTGKGWALFEPNITGVLIRSSAFSSTALEFQNSSYAVKVIYPGSSRTPLVDRYIASIKNAFERTGAEFGDSNKNPKRPHTVLITPGIEGTTSGNTTTLVYPDPSDILSVYVQNVDSARGEELFIHAVTHIYNRFRNDLLAYQKNQSPIPQADWQELEAVWAETAFRSSDIGRKTRIDYMYNVHTAVQLHNFKLITSAPFNDREAFDAIKPTVVLDAQSAYIDAQYGHYVLGALALVGTEGLLQKYGTKTDIERIFLGLHTGKTKNFFDELEKVLPSKEVANVKAWMTEGKTIPFDLVAAGRDYYSHR